MRRRTASGLVAAGAAIAVVVVASVVWPGLDAQETPEVDTAVWALQTGEGSRYARVNAAVDELDTVRAISNPDQVVQTGDAAYVFSDSYSKVTRIDEALPTDLDEEALRASESTPAGTTDIATAGDFVAYRTEVGAVFAGLLSTGEPTQLDPFPSDDENAPQYTADAIAVDERGILFAYSRQDGSVLRFDVGSGEVQGRDPLTAEGLAAPEITSAGDVWAVVDAEDGDVWLRGAESPAQAPTTGAVVVGEPDAAGTDMYLADETALIRVPADGSDFDIETGGTGTVFGTPARPIVHDGTVYAAWLAQGDAGGVLWRSDAEPVVLGYGAKTLPDQRRPTFVSGGGSVILNETRSGWAWSVPDGTLIPSSQDWSLDDRVDPDAVPSEEQLPVVLDPKPPIAEPDAFGVRAGSLTSLPVLMNDHDPNENVLSIDPASVTGLDPGFGAVSITDDGQRLAIRTTPGATGSATFSYAVTDGTSEAGLLSKPTTVTLTAVAASVDSAPQWCGVERCLVEWPEPEVARGGTVTVPVLPGWVDPEGDPLLLLSVVDTTGGGSVAATPSGDVVYQHDDDGSGGEELVELVVTVSDTEGMTAEKSLLVRVSPEPQLHAQSFAVVDRADASLTIDVAPHVTGTAGRLALDSVRVLDDAAATATVVDGTTSFDFSAKSAGTFQVDFTVTDGTTDATGTARITLLPADAPADLATSPVVAFVHPQEDATLDVFAAVSNPTRRVLLLSDVVATADDGATLSVDGVGQNNLRVSGSTATGAAGRLGTVRYIVSDGTEDRGSSVEGEATVYLLPPAPELAPIAVDDTVVVRAGAQIDIPVLENDISPAGGRPTLNPATVVSTTDKALAFASGDLLRYLAPSKPGEYGVNYSVFTTGAPALADTATVRIRVLADDTNRAPVPDTLEGRALSGQSAVIAFDGFGMDPDGDVVTLDRIVSQPERGGAAISADGSSIVYSSVPGDSGQVSFRYRVVDAFGKTGEATVRIGVLDSEANPSPITFTDYVQVQAGGDSRIRVSPLANDVDPTLGSLEITDVRPDLPETLMDGSDNPEFARLAARIEERDDSTVVIAAGTEPTTMSFLYDIESSSGNTGRGLIVVEVVRESVPDYPVVADTSLTAETREDFPDGVDVLEGKATWSGGDVSGLSLSLWGDADEVSADGWELSGPLPAKTRVIPFAVTGEGSSGEVTTYAFLRVPGDDDLALALRAGVSTPEVTELESVSFDMTDLVGKPRGSRIEVGRDLRASGAREEAECRLESGTTVRYDSGAGAPWVDSCQVPVRLEGQDDWTYLSVPITVTPLDPQPVLRPGSMTVGPGETATFDLRNLTTWQLREDWAGIVYKLDYSGSAFDVSLDGSTVTVTGADRAVPGNEEAAIVTVTSHPLVASVRLILRVGAAPSTLPQGGSAVQQCSQASGSSCTIAVIGAGGEVNPLPRTPLEVVDVRPTGACVGVEFRVVSPTSVLASWSAEAPGATCTASFSVRDAQSRVTNAERDGRVLLDLLGYPKAPASVSQSAYADGSLTLRVDPGEARQAYPALSGFVVRWNGQTVAQCTADGTCPAIEAPNGEERTYEAFAVNGVGESRTGVRTAAWAYDTPPSPSAVTVRPVVTAGEGGLVALAIEGLVPSETGSVEINSATGERVRIPLSRNQTRLDVLSYRVGTNSATPITVTPFSRFALPPGLGGSESGAAVTVSGNGIGAPLDPRLSLSSESNGNGTATVTARATALRNGDGSTIRFGIVQEGDRCTPTVGGDTATFPGLQDGNEYTFRLCAESWSQDEAFGSSTVTEKVRAVQSGRAPTGWTFAVAPDPNVDGQRADWVIRDAPQSSERLPNRNRVEFRGWPTSVVGQNPNIEVRYVHELWGTATPWAAVSARAGSAPYPVQATWSVASCVGGSDLAPAGSSTDAAAAFAFGNGGLVFYDQNDNVLPRTPDTWAVPLGAVRVDGIAVSVNWDSRGWGLAAASSTFSAVCDPNTPALPNP
ncbi:Ig-like domain-containing protein [Microbacterium sp. SSM24]|uniref:Ig-like domain-containing protein n=1 Tax=Microbacterium sp. SSM24 TaxID=2991714 RepID=UPI002227CA2A|nr:Ig-like domain-containing protein [Microbacterium sp. SSM24]MCW3492381.1 Ig-like domain-containing protein [Microbacterium sp. SSM24]